ncbi:chromosome segregation protein SMC [uncultured Umboniibacter sp.]|uniref:chromosome segregation protein SMC n=1 Tax=uncultured Umboniibacter sp. TaxID=1798917 RepID=UPI002622CE30|nr:chromosome segregation protein SMC [uncultured Umboniibacter sp.]
MRLKSIKLAGFKSFVDPTTVHFPSNLSAVVGPNGCGKSNVIDAVRWVMGESSAKNLRGESMTDVIFNGSSGRKPVGQASIELVFDNSDHSIQGEWNQFSEVSVKRKVTRESQNTYYINGTKCRRRDITDIFLGTGLGPRSYAIIEQGMISRLIESKPDELRVFIEEAAGISKYKDRRRDTENRIKRTRENLERLTDLRDELGRQLERLARQASEAQRYRKLRAEERELKAMVIAVQWNEFDQKLVEYDARITELDKEIEDVRANKMGAESKIDLLRNQSESLQQSYQTVQQAYFQLGSKMAQLEQSAKFSEDKSSKLQQELQQSSAARSAIDLQREGDHQQLSEAQSSLALLEPDLMILDESLSEQQRLVDEERAVREQAFEALQQCKRDLATFEQRKANVQQQINQQDTTLQQIAQRKQSLKLELEKVELGLKSSDLTLFAEQRDASSSELAEMSKKVADTQLLRDQFRAELNKAKTEQSELSHTSVKLESRLEAIGLLLAERETADLASVIAKYNLDDSPTLMSQLKVPEAWQTVFSWVLGAWLDARISSGDHGHDVVAPNLLVVSSSLSPMTGSLASLVEAGQVPDFLNNILVAEDLAQAQTMRRSLAPGQSVICKTGEWLSRNTQTMLGEQTAIDPLVLLEEQRLISDELRENSELLEASSSNLQSLTAELNGLEASLQTQRQALIAQQNLTAQVEADFRASEATYSQLNNQKLSLQRNEAELEESELLAAELREELSMQLEMLMEESQDDPQLTLTRTLESSEGKLQLLLNQQREAQATQQQLIMDVQRHSLTIDSAQAALARVDEQIESRHEREAELREELSLIAEENIELPLQIEELAEQRMAMESDLVAAKQRADEVAHELRSLESSRGDVERMVEKLRERLEHQRLERQTVYVKLGGLAEQLREHEINLKAVLDSLPEEIDVKAWEAELIRFEQRIKRLGAINLAAIDEYEQEKERKDYLDAHDADLNEALEALEAAIHKIDKETRARFKATFDTVNAGLQTLFPKVFGGGAAWLELTGEDLLDTGVSIMARPPGKKNSTIHLLSGGEKAMTAIALVFSIFQLNPAPFCMLDEVDAPLDDANVGRYARLVEEMSENVQFIYITHNKIAMEMAKQLQGVTMHEPGVSRLVSVDVDEAVALAEA